MRTKLFALASLLILASMVLSACQPAASQPAADEAQPKVLVGEIGPGDIPTLDPSLATDNSSLQVIEETFVGLTRMNEETTEIVPGMAESWTVSEDGLTYTFKLLPNVPWVKYDAIADEVVQVTDCEGNPRMVTAKDYEYGFLRTINPATASDYSYVFSFAIEGAAAYNNAETDDPSTVGVKAIDDTTLEITFTNPAAYNINIAGMWIGSALPSWLIDGDDCNEARAERWTETGFFQGYGPYVMKEWIHDSYITLIKNPFWPGTEEIPQAKIDLVTWHMLDQPPAFAEYEAGNMDYTRVPLADMDRIKSDPTLSAELVIAPQLSTYYYGFNTTAPFVDDARVRRALSMAIDRQAIIDNVTKQEQEPAHWFCRPGLVACPTLDQYPDLGIKYDPEAAKALLQEYLDEKGITAADMDITLMFNTSAAHQRIAESIQAMWKDVLGIDVKLTNQEWKVFLQTVKSLETPQIYRSGWNLDYPDANNFTREVVASGGNDNPTDADGNPAGGLMWKNEKFEELVRQAAVETDPQKRIDLYSQAEQILVYEDAAMIPIYWYTSVQLTKPYVIRTYSNTGTQHIEKWDIDLTKK
ncbi:MAG: peptide ABC transporter substrate-binding protein [Chloroflexi bacterium]|nr:peptide ABC transporter substrate-binding protein [Chloroflexota bacterium]